MFSATYLGRRCVGHSSIIIYVPLDPRHELPAAGQYLSQLKGLLSPLEGENVLPGFFI